MEGGLTRKPPLITAMEDIAGLYFGCSNNVSGWSNKMAADKMVRTNGMDKMVYGQNVIGQNGMDKMVARFEIDYN